MRLVNKNEINALILPSYLIIIQCSTAKQRFCTKIFPESVTTTNCRENDYLAEVRQLRLEDKRTLQLTSQNPNLQKVDCKKSGQVPTSHLFNRVPVFLGAGGESGVHPRSLLLLAGDIETNPGPGAEIIDVLDSGNELSTVEYERLDSSSNSIHIVRGNEDIQELNWGIWGLGMLIVVMD